MKKTYVKPALMVESFVLNQNIAASCSGVPGGGDNMGMPAHSDKGSCGWNIGGVILWVEASTCNMQVGEDTETVIGCYNNPTPNMSIFGS